MERQPHHHEVATVPSDLVPKVCGPNLDTNDQFPWVFYEHGGLALISTLPTGNGAELADLACRTPAARPAWERAGVWTVASDPYGIVVGKTFAQAVQSGEAAGIFTHDINANLDFDRGGESSGVRLARKLGLRYESAMRNAWYEEAPDPDALAQLGVLGYRLLGDQELSQAVIPIMASVQAFNIQPRELLGDVAISMGYLLPRGSSSSEGFKKLGRYFEQG